MSNTAFSVAGTVASGGGSGTVTQVNTGTGLTGGPITTTGTISAGTELAGLSALAADGLVTRTGSGTYDPVTITGTSGQITVTNGSGVSGNPTISLPATGVSAGSFTNASITVDATGRLSAASSGAASAAFISESVTLNPTQMSTSASYAITSTPAAGSVIVPILFIVEYLWVSGNTGYSGYYQAKFCYYNGANTVVPGYQNGYVMLGGSGYGGNLPVILNMLSVYTFGTTQQSGAPNTANLTPFFGSGQVSSSTDISGYPIAVNINPTAGLGVGQSNVRFTCIYTLTTNT